MFFGNPCKYNIPHVSRRVAEKKGMRNELPKITAADDWSDFGYVALGWVRCSGSYTRVRSSGSHTYTGATDINIHAHPANTYAHPADSYACATDSHAHCSSHPHAGAVNGRYRNRCSR